jgi:holin-like protein
MLPCMLRIMLCLLAGELTVEGLGLVFPASLCGMLYLLAWLKVTDHVSPDMEATASSLVGNMGLLFVPAGAAIVTFADTLRTDWLAIVIAVVASTSVAIALAGLLARRQQARAVAVAPGSVR